MAGPWSASGVHHGRGWTVTIGSAANSETSDVAAMHEAVHDRLQFTTLYGGVVLVMSALGETTGDDRWNTRATQMARAYRNVHEEFATWMSITAYGWNIVRLQAQFPIDTRHARSAAGRVATIPHPYLAIHAVQEVARSAMQPAQLADALAGVGLRALVNDPTPRTVQPDHRLHRLGRGSKPTAGVRSTRSTQTRCRACSRSPRPATTPGTISTQPPTNAAHSY